MTNHRESIDATIDRSSLGEPTVRRLRARTTVKQRSTILRKASARSARESGAARTKRRSK